MRRKYLLKILAFIWMISGLTILAGVFWPIIFYRSPSNQIQVSGLAEPVPTPTSSVLNQDLDYTKASNWFLQGAARQDFYAAKVTYYTLSLSKLKIENAVVAIGGDDLAKSLIQYPGTALPGKLGNSVIFGHSVLPIFFNPKNYISIFSTLSNLKSGDEIVVNYDSVTYKYAVEKIFEVNPTDIQVLQQDKSDSFLTLVTCVPPGDPRKPRRLIVRARIIPLE
jgi:sortase A